MSNLKISATYVAICISLILTVTKFFAWNMTNSISIQSSFIDSLVDGAKSVFTFIAIKYSMRPPNAKFKWGYGKAESLASFAQSIVMLFVSGAAIWDIFVNINSPKELIDSNLGISVMFLSLILTIVLVGWQRYVIKKTNSLLIKLNCLHYENDILTNLGIIISFFVSSKFNFVYVDIFVGLIIIINILFTSIKILLSSAKLLMDHEIDNSIAEKIFQIVIAHANIKAIHSLKTRSSGIKHFVQICIGLDDNLTIRDSVRISSEIKASIKKEFDNIEIIIDQDSITNPQLRSVS